MKRCNKCGVDKPLDQYSKNKNHQDGHQHFCKECFKVYREANKKALAAQKASYYSANKQAVSQRSALRYQREREKLLDQTAKWAKDNADKRQVAAKRRYAQNRDVALKHSKEYYQKNKSTVYTKTARRRAARISRTPVWADQVAIKSYYDVCSFFNELNGYIKYHVDHIVPLQGKNVSGLHVHHNLRVILATENLSKNNRFEIQS